tara:strand:+ start:4271 stop:4471 length:201 start_codon:yes stop_codon:yes gene_type:complete
MSDPRTTPEQPFDDFDTQRQVEEEYPDPPYDGADEDGLTDVEADAMTLRDCGMGTDEDYGFAADII